MKYDVIDLETMHGAIAEFCRFLETENVSQGSIFDCRLVASELLANVLQHAKAQAKLSGRIEDGRIYVTVYSSVAYTPPTQTVLTDVYAERGRGLFLVDSVCEERETIDGKEITVKIRIK